MLCYTSSVESCSLQVLICLIVGLMLDCNKSVISVFISWCVFVFLCCQLDWMHNVEYSSFLILSSYYFINALMYGCLQLLKVIGTRVGGGGNSRRSSPGKSKTDICFIWGIFLLLFSYYRGLFCNIGAVLLPHSLYGEPFSSCGGPFVLMVGLFGACPPPSTKISAGSHA